MLSLLKKNFLRITSISLIIITVFICVWLIKRYHDEKQHRQNVEELLSFSALQHGDLIFRKGRSIESRVVLITDKESNYSHVGVIYMKDDSIFVIHAVPGESESGINYIKLEEIKKFLSLQKARKAAVYRLSNPQQGSEAGLAAERAMFYFDQKLVFDDDFDLSCENKLYCTELVWKAFLDADIDLTEGNVSVLNIPLKKGDFLLPSIFLKSSLLKKIYEF